MPIWLSVWDLLHLQAYTATHLRSATVQQPSQTFFFPPVNPFLTDVKTGIMYKLARYTY